MTTNRISFQFLPRSFWGERRRISDPSPAAQDDSAGFRMANSRCVVRCFHPRPLSLLISSLGPLNPDRPWSPLARQRRVNPRPLSLFFLTPLFSDHRLTVDLKQQFIAADVGHNADSREFFQSSVLCHLPKD